MKNDQNNRKIEKNKTENAFTAAVKSMVSIIKKGLVDFYEIAMNKNIEKELPVELQGTLKKSRLLMISLGIVMLITAALIGFSPKFLAAALLIEMLLFVSHVLKKKALAQKTYTVVTAKVVGSESPWWNGGKLNRKIDKQLLLLEKEDRTLVKCLLGGNVSANLSPGSVVTIFGKDVYTAEDGVIEIASYYNITNCTEGTY